MPCENLPLTSEVEIPNNSLHNTNETGTSAMHSAIQSILYRYEKEFLSS